MTRSWKRAAGMMAWLGAALPALAQGPGAFPPPPVPVGVSSQPTMASAYPGGPSHGMPGLPPGVGLPPGGPGAPPGKANLPELDGRSIRENAFNADCDPDWLPYRCQLSFEYLFFHFKPFNLPPTVTTGSDSDDLPGALGQPGTQILSGNGGNSAGASSAFRVTLMSWLTDPEVLGLETNFWIMETRTLGAEFASDDTGTPLIARPYFDSEFGLPNADVRATPAGFKVGVARDFVQTRLMGAEANIKYNITGSPSRCGPTCTMFAGPRWVKLDERFSTDDFSQDIPPGTGQTFLSIRDNFTTYNSFIGGQVGLTCRQRWERFTIDSTTKLGVGENFQKGRISGFTRVRNDVTGGIISTPQGFYAQPSNIGTYSQQQTSILPEFGVNLGVFLTENCKFGVGYGAMFMTNVLRPGNILDTTINTQQPNGSGTPPQSQLKSTDLWAQWLSLSLEIAY